MAFDEQGQADSTSSARSRSAERSYRCACGRGRFRPGRHHFRPEHLCRSRPASPSTARYGSRRSSTATREIKARLPHALVSPAGYRNVSFSVPWQQHVVREAIHSVYSCTTRSGQAWTWGSSTQASSLSTRIIPTRTAQMPSRMSVLNRREDGTDRLLEMAERYRGDAGGGQVHGSADDSWRENDAGVQAS